jgi:hypothetical protein
MRPKNLYESDLLFLSPYKSRSDAGQCTIVQFTNEACIDEHSLEVLYKGMILKGYIDSEFTTLSIIDPKLNATFRINKILSQYKCA